MDARLHLHWCVAVISYLRLSLLSLTGFRSAQMWSCTAVLYFLFVVRFWLCEPKTNNRCNEKYHLSSIVYRLLSFIMPPAAPPRPPGSRAGRGCSRYAARARSPAAAQPADTA